MATAEVSAALESDLSDVALALFAEATVDDALQRMVDLAVMTVDGCDAAGIFLVENEQVVSKAYSDPLVVEVDGLQFEADEGPCLDAVSEGGSFFAPDLADDTRWPTFGPAAAAAGVRSVLALQLSAVHLGALNLYACLPAAFGVIDRAKASIFTTLAGIALNSAEEREGDGRLAENLRTALRTSGVIGQAQGILMERERITADQAFDVLRRASQRLNVKLREVAQDVVDNKELRGRQS
ncbi:MAG: GAF and ANTAR domain-containing protein [Actinomycetota bacterium]|nr:GAF and ANTAR domain-containing protein [Actinomycetota bacterium]